MDGGGEITDTSQRHNFHPCCFIFKLKGPFIYKHKTAQTFNPEAIELYAFLTSKLPHQSWYKIEV